MRIGKVRLTSPFQLIDEQAEIRSGNDRAALGILARALTEAAGALDTASDAFRNGQATPMLSQRAHFAAKAARQVLEDLGITRRAPTAAASRART